MATVDILGIAAHPDDIELSSAGTMLMAKRAGKRAGILDLTQGELSTRGTVTTRAVETKAASKILKLDFRDNLKLPDGNIELSQENIMKVIRHLRALRPTIVICPNFSERHPDHEAAAELVHRAAFYSGLVKIESKGSDGKLQKPHRPLVVLHYMQTYSFEPKLVVDVSAVWKERMDAMLAYGSQINRSKNGKKMSSKEPKTFLTQAGFYEWISSRARHFGMMIGAEYGEPFWCEGPVGVKNIFDIVTKKIS
jgi:bacillithiol biosynthesis deacetylase BshB1